MDNKPSPPHSVVDYCDPTCMREKRFGRNSEMEEFNNMLDARPHKTGQPFSSALSISWSPSLSPSSLPRVDSIMEPPSEDLRNHTQSKMPTYRSVDLQRTDPAQLSERGGGGVHGTSCDYQLLESSQGGQQGRLRNNSTSDIKTPTNPPMNDTRPLLKASRHLSFPTDHSSQPPRPVDLFPSTSAKPESAPEAPKTTTTTTPKRNPKPLTNSRKSNNGPSYPPLSMITRGFSQDSTSTATSTTNWVAQQSMTLSPRDISASSQNENPPSSNTSQPYSQPTHSIADSTSVRAPIKVAPIRGFKSSRKSAEMASRRLSQEPGSSVRVYETHQNAHRRSGQPEQDEHNSDESDLFLRAAHEEELAQQQNTMVNTNGFSPNRRSRIGQRTSVPPSSLFNSGISRRRGSDQDDSNGLPMTMDGQGQESIAQALTYRPAGRDRPAALEDLNRTRYTCLNSRSTPTTPRGTTNSETSPEEYLGRRPSIPDATLPPRASYRQSNLSYSMPRTYNSSPLISRTADLQDTPETPRAAEGTESTVSTTAPSTVWDELDELKSRIHRLELTGKLPPTSGAAMSRASADRPPTATTTITTVSSSPKRGRVNSISPVEPTISVGQPPAEAHPLLHAALAKAKFALSAEVYKTLEAATSDALAISAMMGTSGQPGPISSSQSTVGGPSTGASDRQVRRKTDSMCRSLTELCLALSEEKTEAAPVPTSQALVRPRSRDLDVLPSIETNNMQRPATNAELNRVKSSPRTLSRLEARRSSLLATSTLPAPRYAPSEAGTLTQTGRRTSMFLRSRRTGTEEPEDDDTFRAPSRATTEVARPRQSTREYTPQQPPPERSSSITSSLPVRRHYASTSLTNTAPPAPPVSALNNRRYLDRSTPERETTSVMGRLAEDRAQRKSSIGAGFPLGRTSSLTRRARQPPTGEYIAGQTGGYQQS